MVETTNFGIIKHGLVKSSTSLYLNENKLDGDLKEFLEVIKNSPILTLEYIIYKNIENKKINDDTLATRYIDENISLLKGYKSKQIVEENNKISKFVKNIEIDDSKVNLYNSISTIILENTTDKKYKNVDIIHSSFEVVLNHIKNNKNTHIEEGKGLFEEYKDKYFNIDFIFNNAVNKFNEKYSHLSEGEKRILKILIKEDIKEKENMYQTLIIETNEKIDNLLKLEESPETGNKLLRVKEKLNTMIMKQETLVNDIIKLNNLKESL